MSIIERSIDVDVPVRTAYNQWTQFEEFPHFMQGVHDVQQIDDAHFRWMIETAGSREEWVTRVGEQVPDERIAWTSEDDPPTHATVTFRRIADDRTRVTFHMEYEPHGATGTAGDLPGLASRRAEGDLGRFKEFIEERERTTDARGDGAE